MAGIGTAMTVVASGMLSTDDAVEAVATANKLVPVQKNQNSGKAGANVVVKLYQRE